MTLKTALEQIKDILTNATPWYCKTFDAGKNRLDVRKNCPDIAGNTTSSKAFQKCIL